MKLGRYRVRWWDSREGGWRDITMLSECEFDCHRYANNITPYSARVRDIDGMNQDSLQIFFLAEVVLPYVLIWE